MHPIDLMRKYGWSYLELAIKLGVTEAEARRWDFNKKASNYRNPSQTVLILSKRIDLDYSNSNN